MQSTSDNSTLQFHMCVRYAIYRSRLRNMKLEWIIISSGLSYFSTYHSTRQPMLLIPTFKNLPTTSSIAPDVTPTLARNQSHSHRNKSLSHRMKLTYYSKTTRKIQSVPCLCRRLKSYGGSTNQP